MSNTRFPNLPLAMPEIAYPPHLPLRRSKRVPRPECTKEECSGCCGTAANIVLVVLFNFPTEKDGAKYTLYEIFQKEYEGRFLKCKQVDLVEQEVKEALSSLV